MKTLRYLAFLAVCALSYSVGAQAQYSCPSGQTPVCTGGLGCVSGAPQIGCTPSPGTSSSSSGGVTYTPVVPIVIDGSNNISIQAATDSAPGYISAADHVTLTTTAANVPGFDKTSAVLWDVFTLAEGSGTTLHGSVNGHTCTLGSAGTDPQWSGNSLLFAHTTTGFVTCAGMSNPATFQVVAYFTPTTSQGNKQTLAGMDSAVSNGFYFGGSTFDVNIGNNIRMQFAGNVTDNGLGAIGDQIQTITFSGSGTLGYGYIGMNQLSSYYGTKNLGAVNIPTTGNFTVGGSMAPSAACPTAGTCEFKDGQIMGFAVYSTQPATQALMDNLVNTNELAWANVLRSHGLKLGQWNNAFPTTQTALVCGLTSIEMGYGSSQPPCLSTRTGLSSTLYNPLIPAVFGSTLNAWVASGMQSFSRYLNATPTAGRAYAFLGDAPTNDLCQISATTVNSTVAGSWQLLQQAVRQLKAMGYQKVIVGTMISRTGNGGGTLTGSTCDTLKNQMNALIRANEDSTGYTLADIAQHPLLGADGANTNTTYFQGDFTHPTAAGDLLYGAALGNVVGYIDGSTSASPSVPTSNTYAMTSADKNVLAAVTATSTWSLPECIGLTGKTFSIINPTAFAITLAGINSETITGSATIGIGSTTPSRALFRVMLTSPAAGGCSWLREQ